MTINIGVIQFPGSNTERETGLAIKRGHMNAVEILWNSDTDSVANCDGYIITGGFSFEDRSRAGIIASLDPIMKTIKEEAEKAKYNDIYEKLLSRIITLSDRQGGTSYMTTLRDPTEFIKRIVRK